MSFKITKQMCKDLDKIFATEKTPRDTIFLAAQKKWIMPHEKVKYD